MRDLSEAATNNTEHELPPWLRYFEHLGVGQQRDRSLLLSSSSLPALEAAAAAAATAATTVMDADDDGGESDVDDAYRHARAWEERSAEFGPFEEEEDLLLLQRQDTFGGGEPTALEGGDAADPIYGPCRRQVEAHDERSAETAIPIDDNDDRESLRAPRNAETTTKTARSPVAADKSAAVSDRLVRELERAIHRNDHDSAVRAFDRLETAAGMSSSSSVEKDVVVISLVLLARLSRLVGYQNGPPFVAHRVLKMYQRQHHLQHHMKQHASEDGSSPSPTAAAASTAQVDPELINSMVGWYKSICYNVRNVDPQSQYNHEIQALVRSLVADSLRMTNANKKEVYPILIASLVKQRSVRVGMLARPIFDSLLDIVQQEQEDSANPKEQQGENDDPSRPDNDRPDNDPATNDDQGPLNAAFFEHLIGHARYQRRDDLPYPQILRMLSERRRPFPVHAVAVLENLFPFDNLDDTAIALRALVNLQSAAWQQQQQGSASDESIEPARLPHNDDPKESVRDSYRYVVDMSTLETIGAAAARQANVEVSLLVWDAVHVMGHREPATPAIYETLVLVFCAHRSHYGSAFTVLAEMEERGYPIPRALIRSMSTKLRYVATTMK